jgi:hypothetical protein
MAVDMGGVYAGLQNDALWAVESRPLAANPAHTGEAALKTSSVDFAALHESGSDVVDGARSRRRIAVR